MKKRLEENIQLLIVNGEDTGIIGNFKIPYSKLLQCYKWKYSYFRLRMVDTPFFR